MPAGELATSTFEHFRTRFNSKGYSSGRFAHPVFGRASRATGTSSGKPFQSLDNLPNVARTRLESRGWSCQAGLRVHFDRLAEFRAIDQGRDCNCRNARMRRRTPSDSDRSGAVMRHDRLDKRASRSLARWRACSNDWRYRSRPSLKLLDCISVDWPHDVNHVHELVAGPWRSAGISSTSM
jgi:hypothetical protein